MQKVEEVLSVRSGLKVLQTVKKMMKSKASENEKTNSLFTMDIIEMTRNHMVYLAFKVFKNAIETGSIKCKRAQEHLKNLAILFGLIDV